MKIALQKIAIILLITFPITHALGQQVLNKSDYKKSLKYYNLAQDLSDKNRYNESIEPFNKSIELNNGNVDALAGRANALLKLSQFTDALNDIQKAMELSQNQSDLYYLAGNILFRQKQYSLAIPYYDSAILYNSISEVPISIADCNYNLGVSFLISGNYTKALEKFTTTIQLDDAFKNAYHNRAIAFRHLKQKDKACIDFKIALSLGSNKSERYINQHCK